MSRNEIPQYEDTRKDFRIGIKDYHLTPDGIATIRFYLMMVADERRKLLENGEDTDEAHRNLLFNDIIEDIELWGLDKNDEFCYYYMITDEHESKYPIHLKLGRHFVEYKERTL